jgi:uncharacterized membrane protein (UPF0127 family)
MNLKQRVSSLISRLGVVAIGAGVLLGCTSSAISPSDASLLEVDRDVPRSSTPTELIESDHAQAEGEPVPVPRTDEQNGQYLPISAETEIGGQRIQLEVARTPQEQSKGLMHRPPLPDDRGMLFLFNPPRPVQFWMKNTPSPLDMVFLRDGEVQAIVESALPCQADPCPTYGPDRSVPIDQVIELRSGRAAELGLTAGDRITIEFLE